MQQINTWGRYFTGINVDFLKKGNGNTARIPQLDYLYSSTEKYQKIFHEGNIQYA